MAIEYYTMFTYDPVMRDFIDHTSPTVRVSTEVNVLSFKDEVKELKQYLRMYDMGDYPVVHFEHIDDTLTGESIYIKYHE